MTKSTLSIMIITMQTHLKDTVFVEVAKKADLMKLTKDELTFVYNITHQIYTNNIH